MIALLFANFGPIFPKCNLANLSGEQQIVDVLILWLDALSQST